VLPLHAAVPGLQPDQRLAAPHDQVRHRAVVAGDIDADRRRIPGHVVVSLPDHLPIGLVEGDDRSLGGPDVDDQLLAVDQWCGRDTPADVLGPELLQGVRLPGDRSRLRLQAQQVAITPQGVDPIAFDDRCASRPVAV